MIKNYKQFESLLDNLKGPSEEEYLKSIVNMEPNKILVDACKGGFLIGVKIALKNGANINKYVAKSYGYDTPLTIAVREQNVDVVKYLIKNGANVSLMSDAAIKWSVRYSSLEIVDCLIKNGANPTNGLYNAIREKKYDIIKFLFDNGAKILQNGENSFEHAVMTNDIKTIDLFIEYGANPNTGLLVCSKLDFLDTFKYLISKGANDNFYLEQAYKNTKTYKSIGIARYMDSLNNTNESLLDKLQGPSKDEIWKHYGYDRTFYTPEEFLNYILDGVKIKEQNKDINSIYWGKDGKILMKRYLTKNFLYIDRDIIWKPLESIFELKYSEMRKVISKVIEEKLNITEVEPTWRHLNLEYVNNISNNTNESLLDKLQGPSEEDILKHFGLDKIPKSFDNLLSILCNDMRYRYEYYDDKTPIILTFTKNEHDLFEYDFSQNYITVSSYLKTIINMLFNDIKPTEIVDTIKKHMKSELDDDFEVNWYV